MSMFGEHRKLKDLPSVGEIEPMPADVLLVFFCHPLEASRTEYNDQRK